MNNPVFRFHFYTMFKRLIPGFGSVRNMALETLWWVPPAIGLAIGAKKFTELVLADIWLILGYWITLGVVGTVLCAVLVGIIYGSIAVIRFRGYEVIQRSPGYRAFKMTQHEREFRQYCTRHIPKDRERIIASANVDSQGNVWAVMRPGRHHHVIWFMGDYNKNHDSRQQGFLTNKFRFLGRQDARKLAMKNGQSPKPYHHKDLFSEDLWRTPAHLRQEG